MNYDPDKKTADAQAHTVQLEKEASALAALTGSKQ